MLKKQAFANSLAALCGIFYVVFFILSMVAPALFKALFNAQFFGANLAPSNVKFDVIALIALIVMGWVMGYIWAWLYNRFAK